LEQNCKEKLKTHVTLNVLFFVMFFCFIDKNAGDSLSKGKAIPLQAWTVPEGSRSLRLPDFKTIGT
jgi:hypothetical protein